MNDEKVAYLNGLPIGMNICSVRNYPPHWHNDEIEIIYMLEGTADIIVSFDSYKASKGDFILINQGEIHHINTDEGDCEILSLFIRLDAFSAFFPYIKHIYFCWQSFNLSKLQLKNNRMLEKQIFSLFIEIMRSPIYDSDKIIQDVSKIIHMLIHHFDIIHSFNQNVITSEQLSKYHHIIKFIEENYSEKISMTELAREEYMGRNYVSQFWKKVTDMNFTEFLNCRRVELAEKLILTTDLSLQSISLQCGFSDPKYFYKYFKKWYSCTPLEHRKKFVEYYEKLPADFEYKDIFGYAEFFQRLLADCYAQEDGHEERSREIAAENNSQNAGKIREYLRTRLKKELIKENLKHYGVRNLSFDLFSSGIIEKAEREYVLDWSMIDDVVKFAETLDLSLTISIDLMRGNDQEEWEQILKKISRHLKGKGKAGSQRRIKYIIYLDELERVSDIKNTASKYINLNEMELSVKF